MWQLDPVHGAPLLLVFGFTLPPGPVSLPGAVGCQLLPSLDLVAPAVAIDNNNRGLRVLRPDASLLPLTVYVQGVVLDVGRWFAGLEAYRIDFWP